MVKLKVGIIGTGNIGTDLLMKVMKSTLLECTAFIGHREASKGIKMAKSMGVFTSVDSINTLIDYPDICDIVFDATSANIHKSNAKIFESLGKFTIDLTPARVGMMCVPAINLEECIQKKNVNMITCGGQATIPLIYAINSVQKDIEYVEVVSNIASKSAGIGTRNNIDEFTQTTKDAIIEIVKIPRAKAIITLNPAEPPVNMHNTIYMKIKNPDITAMYKSVKNMERIVQEYVPGYKVILAPTLEKERVTMMVQVIGAGDYLPSFAGNLDIITCAAVKVANRYAERIMK